jgi:putative transposase
MGDIKRYKEDGYIYFVTTNAYSRKEIFKNQKACEFLRSIISYYRFVCKFKLYSYCIMPEHLHLIIQPLSKQYDISVIMKEIKGTFAREYNILTRKGGEIWQRRFYDSVIKDENDLMAKINYIFENPVRKGIVKTAIEYEFSSAKNYLLNEKDYITDIYQL